MARPNVNTEQACQWWLVAHVCFLVGLPVLACTEPRAAERSAPLVPATAPTGDSSKVGERQTVVTLDGLRVGIDLPSTWRLAEARSDAQAGLVAFVQDAPSLTSDRTRSLFLDGSRDVTFPVSQQAALAAVLADSVCEAAGSCTSLAQANLGTAGMLVSVRKPHAVYTETWHRNSQGRTVRCGAEISNLGSADPSAPSWLTNRAAVLEAERECESLCKAVVALP